MYVMHQSPPSRAAHPQPGRVDDLPLTDTDLGDDLDDGHLDDVVDRAREGDIEAFGELFEECHPHVYRFLVRFTRSEALAEDLTAEAFLRALRSVSGFRGSGPGFRAWVIVIARNLALDHFGSRRHRLEQVQEDIETHGRPAPGSDSEVVASCTRDLILEALDQVPRLQREVVVGRFLQDLSISELAVQLDRSEGAVKQLQWRGLRSLSRMLSEDVKL